MIRILIGTVLGAVVLYVWNMAAWMVLPIHMDSIHNLKDTEAVKKVLVEQELKPGYYIIPGMAEDYDKASPKEQEAMMEACMQAHREGPVVSIVYADGMEAMSPAILIGGFGIDLGAAFLAALLLSSAGCCRNYFQRVGFVFGMGLFAFLVSYLSLLNWMAFPLDFTLGMLVDMAVGWLLAGVFMALVIRPTESARAGTVASRQAEFAPAGS